MFVLCLIKKLNKPLIFHISHITAIGVELQKADQLAAEIPEQIGMFTVKTANRTIKEAALRPNPDALWLTLWYEGEVCCLFSDSNLGKSIYAVQIATSIADKQRVLYFDFELSDKQFQLRYSDGYSRGLSNKGWVLIKGKKAPICGRVTA